MSTQPSNAARQSWLSTLGWAAYLACSWTWCIGMFLPVLLVRDYGIWGFVVFAVPNVIGAAAMGWVLSDPASARELLRRHASAITSFACITAMFQVFFLAWCVDAAEKAYSPTPLATSAPPSPVWLKFAGNAAIFAGIGALASGHAGARRAAIVLWIASASGAGYLLSTGELDLSLSRVVLPASGISDLLFLAPVCAFGFALCPYLDPTFLHAAASQTRSGNKTSFTLGFGVMFACMICFTLGYAWAFMPLINGSRSGTPSPSIVGIVMLHMALQVCFTIWVHAVQGTRTARLSKIRPSTALGIGVLVLVPILLGVQYNVIPEHAGLSGGELVYRVFLSFYGLVFPAYVWLCMIPTRDGHSGIAGPRGHLKLAVLVVATLLAAPCYWMGFIEREEIWLVPGLGVVLLARLLVRGHGSRQFSTTPAH